MPQPTITEAAWLSRLTRNVHSADLLVPVARERDDYEPIVYCAWDGTWWAGRYVGSVSFEGHSLTISPRYGLATLRNWLFGATSVVLTESPGRLREDETFIAQLLASVWAQGFVEAARHGLPALRQNFATQGTSVRGRIDINASLRHIAGRTNQLVSIRSERSLDHAASNAIVAAYEVLRRWLGVPDDQWMPARARELLPHLMAVTGARPRVPTKAELDRIRYTPITAGFAPIAELSRQISNRRGLSSNVDADGETKGVLLDVAELWEMYLLSVLRKAASPMSVTHGTRERSATKALLHSEVSGHQMGSMIPDAILHQGPTIRGVADAKYKSLHPSTTAPYGPQREDLYQMAAYLSRYAAQGGGAAWGLLAYPLDPTRPDETYAERNGPWKLADGKRIVFQAVPHSAPEAIEKLSKLFARLNLESHASDGHLRVNDAP